MPQDGRSVKLAAILCACGETVEDVQMTVDSLRARENEVPALDIVLVDDNNQPTYDGITGVTRLIRHGSHRGRGVSANAAAAESDADLFLFPDCHMIFPDGALGLYFKALTEHHCLACAGVQDIHKLTGCQGWGARFRFHRGGRLGTRYNREVPPDGDSLAIPQPFGGAYGFHRSAFERLGGWSDVAARWGYCEQPLGYAAWVADIPVRAIPSVIRHRYRNVNPSGASQADVWMNVAYSHYVFFQPETWAQYWRPICESHIGKNRVDDSISIPGTEERRARWQAQRPADRTDERFFAEHLKIPVTATADGAVTAAHSATIILPAYNEGPEAAQTIKSIYASTTREPETILVNDASSDGSCERMSQATQDANGNAIKPRQRFPDQTRILVNAQRVGVCRSRLLGIRLAKERILGFMDAHSRVKSGELDKLMDAAHERNGIIVASICGFNDEGHPLYGSRFCVKPKWGLRGAYNLKKPADELNRINMAMGSCYFATRETLESVRLWSPLPGKWAYSEQGLAVKAWNLDVPIYNHAGVLVWHKMKTGTIDVPQEDVLFNAHFVHRCYFDEDTYADVWRPILAAHGYSQRVDDMLKSGLVKDEAAWFKSARKHTDAEFFAANFGMSPSEVLATVQSGKGVDIGQANMVALYSNEGNG